jgi:2'-hydroxyisoflavone reductase
VTTFTRGQTNSPDNLGIEQLHGERDGNLEALRGRTWDVVIDTSGYYPRIVRASAALLADTVERLLFISSCSVYADFARTDIDEDSPVIELADPTIETMETPEAYGGLKLLCERAIEEALPGRTLVVRPGLIVGPYDPTDRFTYWPYRVSLGGEILAPDSPERPVQFIDARDLSAWIIHLAEERATGVYNAKGPNQPLTIGRFLEECQRVAGSDARFTWVSEAVLQQEQVEEYSELPLWVPRAMIGFSTVNSDKAIRAGLTTRPLAETIQDTLEWVRTRPANHEWRSGLKPAREQEILRAWYASR